MNRRTVLLGAAGTLVAAAGVYALWSLGGPHDDREPFGKTGSPLSLRLRWPYDPAFAGELVAHRRNYFAEVGLDVDIRPGTLDSDPIALVTSGAEHIGVAGAGAFLGALGQGLPLVAFCGGFLRSPVVFYAHADANIRSPKDFEGKRVGIQAGQDTATVYHALMKAQGVDTSTITEVAVQYDFTPFLNREIDIWPGYASAQSFILSNRAIPHTTLKPADFGVSFPGTVYFVQRDVFERRAAELSMFLKAMMKGWTDAFTDPAAAAKDVVSYNAKNLREEFVRFALEKQAEFVRPPGYEFCRLNMDDVRRLHNEMIRTGSIPREANLATGFTTLPIF